MAFSSHRCLGSTDIDEPDLSSVDAPWPRVLRNQKERTCVFENVCFDVRGDGWTYYADQHEFSTSSRRRTFRAGIDVWARGNFGRQGLVSEDLTFKVQRRPIPPRAAYLDAPLHVLVAPLAPSNFGHFLGNALFPAFAAIWRMFGAAATALDYQLIFHGPNQTDLQQMRRRCARWEGRGVREAAAKRGHGGGGGRAGGRRGRGGRTGRAGRRLAAMPPQSDPSSDSAAAAAVNNVSEARCAEHTRLVAKFVAGLLPGLSRHAALWSGSLGAVARQQQRSGSSRGSSGGGDGGDGSGGAGGGLLCARQLVAGTGELGFSTVHRLLNGTRRRVAPLLWGDFIEVMLQRFAATTTAAGPPRARATTLPLPMPVPAPGGMAGAAGAGGGEAEAAAAAGGSSALEVLLLRKVGRRAPTALGYRALGGLLRAAAAPWRVSDVDPSLLTVRQQLEIVSRSPLAVTPDGGISFLCAFLPGGASLLVLGTFERWLWVNDRRHRVYYCAPKPSARVACPVRGGASGLPPIAPAVRGPTAASSAADADCYDVAALQPCLDATLRSAVRAARLTWPVGGSRAASPASASDAASASPPDETADVAPRGGARKTRRLGKRRGAAVPQAQPTSSSGGKGASPVVGRTVLAGGQLELWDTADEKR